MRAGPKNGILEPKMPQNVKIDKNSSETRIT